MDLITLGWNDFFAAHSSALREQGYSFARVAVEHKTGYILYSEQGELTAEITGRLRHLATEKAELPVVGDWVAVKIQGEKASICAVLPRKSKFSRKAAGQETLEQIVAANVDTVFLVMGLDQDLNLRRLERYLMLTWESGCSAVIVLNKADICEDVAEAVAQVRSIAMTEPVVAISALHDEELLELTPFLRTGETVALLGSSGVGKSTLVNRLLGYHLQRVQEVRKFADRGKHTTTHRQLITIPTGGLIIDTPGMREIQVWSSEEGLHNIFDDVQELAAQCRFRDCQHLDEPGCAILQAVEQGELPRKRLQNYQKLQREVAFLDRKKDKREQVNSKRRWKQLSKMMRDSKKRGDMF